MRSQALRSSVSSGSRVRKCRAVFRYHADSRGFHVYVVGGCRQLWPSHIARHAWKNVWKVRIVMCSDCLQFQPPITCQAEQRNQPCAERFINKALKILVVVQISLTVPDAWPPSVWTAFGCRSAGRHRPTRDPSRWKELCVSLRPLSFV